MGVKELKKNQRAVWKKTQTDTKTSKTRFWEGWEGRKIAFMNASAVYVYVLASWPTECQLSVTTIDLGHWSMVTRKLQMFVE